MLSLEEAQGRIVNALTALPAETVALSEAAHRVAAEDVRSMVDLPGFDNSAMDGYAVQAADVAKANAQNPVRLRVISEIAAGSVSNEPILHGTAARIFTGSPVPPGADAVVMQEDTQRCDGMVDILDGARPFENVRLKGEDVKAGALLLTKGSVINAGGIALMGASGVARVAVTRRPRVALLSTGNELKEPGERLNPGEIYESNRAALACLASAAGADVQLYPVVRDDLAATRSALERAMTDCDLLVTTGGVSVGEHDCVKAAFEGVGGTLDFWRVAIRPGKPFAFGLARGKLLFGLPGNPVSAFVTFLLLVLPALCRLQGRKDTGLRGVRGVLGERVTNNSDRRHFMRVTVDAEGTVNSSGPQASHRLLSLAAANALLDVAPGRVLEPGTQVQVLQWPE